MLFPAKHFVIAKEKLNRKKEEVKKNMIRDMLILKICQKMTLKYYLNLRIVNIEIKPGVTETLLTNIPEKLASTEELKELYDERWEIETNYT